MKKSRRFNDEDLGDFGGGGEVKLVESGFCVVRISEDLLTSLRNSKLHAGLLHFHAQDFSTRSLAGMAEDFVRTNSLLRSFSISLVLCVDAFDTQAFEGSAARRLEPWGGV